ncbi:MAG: GNAT family N-acetyltransferase [Rhizobiaceae bacterium]
MDGYRPGCLGDIVALHARYYAREWSFGLAFEAKVATELAEFLSRMDLSRDLFVAAYDGDRLAGSIVVDVSGGGPEGAHLRWFIVSDEARGTGLGAALMGRAMHFCDAQGVRRVWLTTFRGLDAARRLYERHGFRLAGERAEDQWQGGVVEQRFVRELV